MMMMMTTTTTTTTTTRGWGWGWGWWWRRNVRWPCVQGRVRDLYKRVNFRVYRRGADLPRWCQKSCDEHLTSGNSTQLLNMTLSGWWFQPLWKIWKSIGMIIPNIWENKKCSKPPTSYSWFTYWRWCFSIATLHFLGMRLAFRLEIACKSCKPAVSGLFLHTPLPAWQWAVSLKNWSNNFREIWKYHRSFLCHVSSTWRHGKFREKNISYQYLEWEELMEHGGQKYYEIMWIVMVGM